MNLTDYIPIGPENGTTIARIATAAGISPRKVRSEINRLRRDKRLLVVTLPKTGGVYMARSPEEYDAAIAHISSRAGALLMLKRDMRRARNAERWSPEMFPGAR